MRSPPRRSSRNPKFVGEVSPTRVSPAGGSSHIRHVLPGTSCARCVARARSASRRFGAAVQSARGCDSPTVPRIPHASVATALPPPLWLYMLCHSGLQTAGGAWASRGLRSCRVTDGCTEITRARPSNALSLRAMPSSPGGRSSCPEVGRRGNREICPGSTAQTGVCGRLGPVLLLC